MWRQEMALLWTTGRRSGLTRRTALLTVPTDRPDSVLFVASFYGADQHPAWYLNLRANPRCILRWGRAKGPAIARELEGDERAAAWKRLVEEWPAYAGYQERTARRLPVVEVRFLPAGSAAPLICVVGGGQLARMMAEESEAAGVRTRVLGTAADTAARIPTADFVTIDGYDAATLVRASSGARSVTFDHEVIEQPVLAELSATRTLRPSAALLRFSQKAYQREQFLGRGLPVPRFVVARSTDEVDAWLAAEPTPWVLKASYGGYDGRGVCITSDADEARRFAEHVLPVEVVCEAAVALAGEAAVLVARGASGALATWPVFDTEQVDGMCHIVRYPSSLDDAVQAEMMSLARRIADEVEAVGTLAVEFFVDVDGTVLINELAPRPHNSGHLTIEASETSQFVNHLRGAAGLDPASTAMTSPAAAMVNIVGRPPDGFDLPGGEIVRGDGWAMHLYGKSPRPARKLGHVTAWGDSLVEAEELASRIAREGPPT